MITRTCMLIVTVFLATAVYAQTADELTIEKLTPEGMTAPPHFSRVVRVSGSGTTIYVAGTTASDHGLSDEAAEYEAQLREVYQKVGLALAAAGATPADVVRQRLHIVGIRPEYATIGREVMQEFYGGPGPASTSVGTNGLFNPDLVVELDVTAVLE